MSCRNTPLGSAAITLCHSLANGELSDASVQSMLHELKKHHHTVTSASPYPRLLNVNAGPVLEKYRRLLNSEAANMSEARQASVERRLREMTASTRAWQHLDSDLLYALNHLPSLVQRRQERLQRIVQNFQSRTRLSSDSVRRRLAEYEKQERLSRVRRLTSEQVTYGELNKLGSDAALIRACMRMEAETEALEIRRLRSAPNLIHRKSNVGGARWGDVFGRIPTGVPNVRIRSVGYDAFTKRLEVELTSGKVHAYRDVPPEIGRRALTRNFISTLWRSEIRGNPAYKYSSEREAKIAGKVPRCLRCGQFAAADHLRRCPSLPDWNRQPVQAAQTIPEGTRLTRERGENGSGVSLPSSAVLRSLPPGNYILPNVTGNRASSVDPWQTFGDIWVKKDSAGVIAVRGQRLTCSCGEPLPCEHVTRVISLTERRLRAVSGLTSETDTADRVPRPRRTRSFDTQPYNTSHNTPVRVNMGSGQALQRISLPNRSILERALSTGPVRFTNIDCAEHYYYSRYDNSFSSSDRSYSLSGNVTVERQENGTYVFSPDGLECSCHQMKPCRHMMGVHNAIRSHISSDIPLLTEAQIRAEAVAKVDWANTEEKIAEARRLHRPATEVNYTDSPDEFLRIVREYSSSSRRSSRPLPYRTENVLGGYARRGEGRGFGIEIEFEMSDSLRYSEREEQLERIGQELYEAGITSNPNQRGYRSARRDGYKDVHVDGRGRGTWSFENDCSVDAELVTPIMYDEPETWERLATAIAIIKRHGGRPTKEAGAHIHVGTGDYRGDAAKYAALMRIMNQHEDVWYRLASDPARGAHRNNGYAVPLASVPPSGFANVAEAKRRQPERYSAVNFKTVTTDSKSHVEFRLFDATLDPGVIQSQVMLAVAATEAAARNSARSITTIERETSGFHRSHTFSSPKEESASTRSLIDTLFVRKADKEQIAALYGRTQWNASISRSSY